MVDDIFFIGIENDKIEKLKELKAEVIIDDLPRVLLRAKKLLNIRTIMISRPELVYNHRFVRKFETYNNVSRIKL